MKVYGHDIVIPPEPRVVIIDGVEHRYGIAGDSFFLESHPHDRADTLVGAIKRYLDYITSRPGLTRQAC